jgi:hypothetical protein
MAGNPLLTLGTTLGSTSVYFLSVAKMLLGGAEG